MTISEISMEDISDTTIMRELRNLVEKINTNIIDEINSLSYISDSIVTITASGTYGTGIYQLEDDLTVTSPIVFSGDAVLMMNGHTVKASSAISVIETYGLGIILGEGTVYGRVYHKNGGDFYIKDVTFYQPAASLQALVNFNNIDNPEEQCVVLNCTFYWDTTSINIHYGNWTVIGCVTEPLNTYSISDVYTFTSCESVTLYNCSANGPYRRFVYVGNTEQQNPCTIANCSFTSDNGTVYSSYYPIDIRSTSVCTISGCSFNEIQASSIVVHIAPYTTSIGQGTVVAVNNTSADCGGARLFYDTYDSFVISWEDDSSAFSSEALYCTYAWDVGDLSCTGTILE